MALTRNEQQVLWSAATSITLSDNNAYLSDAITFDAADIAGAVQICVDNQGTAASGDTLSVYAAYTTGDILGDTGDDYDTAEHAQFVGILDTYATNTPGEDPACKTFPISTTPKGCKIIVQGAQAATRNLVVRTRLITQRAA